MLICIADLKTTLNMSKEVCPDSSNNVPDANCTNKKELSSTETAHIKSTNAIGARIRKHGSNNGDTESRKSIRIKRPPSSFSPDRSQHDSSGSGSGRIKKRKIKNSHSTAGATGQFRLCDILPNGKITL